MLTSTDPAEASSWQQSAGPQGSAVSCPTTSFCVAGNQALGGDIQIGTPPVATATTITSAAASAVVGQPVTVGVEVTSAQAGTGAATPGGTATITAGSSTCSATLSGSAGVAAGSCEITEPAPGSYQVSASYAAQGIFASSASSAGSLLRVGKAAARVRLKLSASRVRYGREHSERLTVTVTPQFAGTPGGEIVVLNGSKTVCSRHLSMSKASCLLANRQLRPGRYRLRVRYDGNSDFMPAFSGYERLRVT